MVNARCWLVHPFIVTKVPHNEKLMKQTSPLSNRPSNSYLLSKTIRFHRRTPYYHPSFLRLGICDVLLTQVYTFDEP